MKNITDTAQPRCLWSYMVEISTVRVHPYYGIISTLHMSLQRTGMRPREWRVDSVSLSGHSEPSQGVLYVHWGSLLSCCWERDSLAVI